MAVMSTWSSRHLLYDDVNVVNSSTLCGGVALFRALAPNAPRAPVRSAPLAPACRWVEGSLDCHIHAQGYPAIATNVAMLWSHSWPMHWIVWSSISTDASKLLRLSLTLSWGGALSRRSPRSANSRGDTSTKSLVC